MSNPLMLEPDVPPVADQDLVPEPVLEPLGRYVLLEKIAQGGMAEVFRAAAVGTAGVNKLLAIKRVIPLLAQDPVFNGMFVDEARIAAQLSHPNILQVLDLGNANGALFIAMEYVAGVSLHGLVSRAVQARVRIPPAMAVHIITEALAGLSFAHRAKDAAGRPLNIIHRDISPQNILLSFDGAVKLSDFGIAKARGRSTHTTQSGAIKGKPGYFAPEQVDMRYGDVDQRVDLYAMGVVLHEAITHRRMRRAGDDMRVLGLVMSGHVPTLAEHGVTGMQGLQAILNRALAPRPEDRFPTAEDFSAALETESARRGWTWTASDSRAFMEQLFQGEMARENAADARYVTVVARLAARSSADTDVRDLLAETRRRLTAVTAEPLEETSRAEVTATSISAPPREPLPAPGDDAEETAPEKAAPEKDAADPLPVTHAEPLDMDDSTEVAPPTLRTEPRRTNAVMIGGAVMVGALLLLVLASGALRPSRGRLHVDSAPAGARVTVDGTPRGTTPVHLEDLPAGERELRLELAGHADLQRHVRVEPGGETRLSLLMEPGVVRVPVLTSPPGGTILVNGRSVGVSPVTVEVPVHGNLRVQARLEGHVDASAELDGRSPPPALQLVLAPAPAQPAAAPARPAPREEPVRREERRPAPARTGAVTFQSQPWARVELDGADTRRFTPTVMNIPAGRHKVRLVNDTERLEAVFNIVVVAGKEQVVSRALK